MQHVGVALAALERAGRGPSWQCRLEVHCLAERPGLPLAAGAAHLPAPGGALRRGAAAPQLPVRLPPPPPLVRFLKKYPQVRQVTMHMGAFGMHATKCTMLLGDAPYLDQLQSSLDEEDRRELAATAVRTARRYVDSAGRLRIQGTAELKGTQTYPLASGAAHALAFQAADRQLAMAGGRPLATAGDASSSSSVLAAAGALRAQAEAGATGLAAAGTAGPAEAGAEGLAAAGPTWDLPDTDNEGEWYLVDVRDWSPGFWHDNAEAESAVLKRARKNASLHPSRHTMHIIILFLYILLYYYIILFLYCDILLY